LVKPKVFQYKPFVYSLVTTIKEATHPNAYLKSIRNVNSGLKARTKILDTVDSEPSSAVRMAKDVSLSYNVVMHHLRLLEREGIVHRKGSRPYFWVSTGYGQKRIS
jgi:DNA-binding transcriptional ArsR family regulator